MTVVTYFPLGLPIASPPHRCHGTFQGTRRLSRLLPSGRGSTREPRLQCGQPACQELRRADQAVGKPRRGPESGCLQPSPTAAPRKEEETRWVRHTLTVTVGAHREGGCWVPTSCLPLGQLLRPARKHCTCGSCPSSFLLSPRGCL